MPDCKIPGPVGGRNHCVEVRESLFLGLASTTRLIGRPPSVAEMDLEDRFMIVLRRTAPKLPGDIREEFEALLSPAALAVIVGVLAVWAGSHYFGVGFIVDAILIGGGVIFLGWQVWDAADDFISFLSLTYSAESESELESAATHLSNFIAVVGVAAFIALLTRGTGKKIKVKATPKKGMIRAAGMADAGMLSSHFNAIRKVAMNANRPRIILFRKTNPNSLKYIERGFPPKPKEIKVKTDPNSGIVTCQSTDEVAEVRKAIDPDSGKQYYTVDRGRTTATNGAGESIDLNGSDWPKEVGQVIDPKTKKPLVGDYDLFDVFDPKVIAGKKTGNQGNLVLATKDGRFVDDFTNPEVRRAVEELNQAVGSRRVMHGHHGAYDSIDNLKAAEVITVFLPDGNVMALDKVALKELYEKIGRSTLDLKRWME